MRREALTSRKEKLKCGMRTVEDAGPYIPIVRTL